MYILTTSGKNLEKYEYINSHEGRKHYDVIYVLILFGFSNKILLCYSSFLNEGRKP